MAKQTKAAQPTDVHVGKRIRMRRMMIGMSQEKLGDELGLTFQQVQKYEKGSNRISASKLQRTANILQVPIGFFFEGGPDEPGRKGNSPTPQVRFADLLGTSEGVELCESFDKIKDKKLRLSIVHLVERIAEAA
jgi:transcriptional regulator with XRE-family HTH domain